MLGGAATATPEAARSVARQMAEAGFDLIKVVFTHENKEGFKALLEEARKQGLRVGGHLPNPEWPLEEIYRSGMVSHEHAFEILTSSGGLQGKTDEGDLRSLLKKIDGTGITVSTLVVGIVKVAKVWEKGAGYLTKEKEREVVQNTGKAGLEDLRAEIEYLINLDEDERKRFQVNLPFLLHVLKELNANGVNLVIGTDSHLGDVFGGSSLHDELDLLVRAGFFPYEALRVATVNGAKLMDALGKEGTATVGTVSVGKIADLVLADENPLGNLNTLRRPAGVMVRGKWLDREELNGLLKGEPQGSWNNESAKETPYNNFHPSWSPQGDWIAFDSNRDGDFEIYLIRPDGTGLRQLTTNTAGDTHPSWSRDGSQIVFESNREGNLEIYVMNSDGTEQKRLTRDAGGNLVASFSPDGKEIAFGSNRDGNLEVCVMNADGSGQRRLTHSDGVDLPISWSPDGKKIALQSTRDGNYEVYTMNRDGTGQIRLTNEPGADFVPSFSPDGSKIAFISDRDGQMELYMMQPDGSNPKRVATDQYVIGGPHWSPDGKRITFFSRRDGTSEIYVMDADGTNARRLTQR